MLAARLISIAVAILSGLGLFVGLYWKNEDPSFDNRIFIALFGSLVVALVVSVIVERATCPKCDEYAGKRFDKRIISSRWTHSRVDGNRDRRYSHNPLIHTYEYSVRCTACDHSWTYTRGG